MKIQNVVGFISLGVVLMSTAAFADSNPVIRFTQIDYAESRLSNGGNAIVIAGRAVSSDPLGNLTANSSAAISVWLNFGADSIHFDHCLKLAAIGGSSSTRNFEVRLLNVVSSEITAPSSSFPYTLVSKSGTLSNGFLGCALVGAAGISNGL